MGDTWEKNRTAADNVTDEERRILLNGTPEEKINTWLKLTKDQNGHLKAGVCGSLIRSLRHIR